MLGSARVGRAPPVGDLVEEGRDVREGRKAKLADDLSRGGGGPQSDGPPAIQAHQAGAKAQHDRCAEVAAAFGLLGQALEPARILGRIRGGAPEDTGLDSGSPPGRDAQRDRGHDHGHGRDEQQPPGDAASGQVNRDRVEQSFDGLAQVVQGLAQGVGQGGGPKAPLGQDPARLALGIARRAGALPRDQGRRCGQAQRGSSSGGAQPGGGGQ